MIFTGQITCRTPISNKAFRLNQKVNELVFNDSTVSCKGNMGIIKPETRWRIKLFIFLYILFD